MTIIIIKYFKLCIGGFEMKFRKEFSRLTMKEAPLDPGQYACKFIEDPNGKLFTELADELVHSTEQDDYSTLLMDNAIYFDTTSEMDRDTYDDIMNGMDAIDAASVEARCNLVKENSKAWLIETGKRPNTFITFRHPAISEEFSTKFNIINVDLSNVSSDDMTANFFKLAQVLNAQQPKTIIISKDFSDKIDESFQLDKFILSQAIHAKNVFVDVETSDPKASEVKPIFRTL